MYTPPAFAVNDLERCIALIQAHPLATLVIQTQGGLEACPIPLYWTPGHHAEGRLIGHLARANPLWQQVLPNTRALVIFQGDQHYISPNWYATKAEAGKVVPTWNYQAVHIHAPVICHDDPDWIRQQMSLLTAQEERTEPHPWQISDAPRDYIDKLLTVVVGIELPIERIEGKFKLSQNQPAANRESVQQALQAKGQEASERMAQHIRNNSPG